MYLFGDPNLGKDNNMPFILSPHFRDLDVDQDYYLHNLYQLFKAQLVEAKLIWPSNNKPVVLRRLPEVRNYHRTFWHIISSGHGRVETRTINFERCRRLHWIREAYEEFKDHYPNPTEDPIKWWKSSRNGAVRYLLAKSDLSYVVVYEERTDYTLLITAYSVSQKHTQRKLAREHDNFWEV